MLIMPMSSSQERNTHLIIKNTKPKGVVVLFPGSKGKLYKAGGALSNNFLVRSRGLFAQLGYTTVVFAPSKKNKKGYTDEFRISLKHAKEIGALIRKFKELPVILIGTSRGVLSASNAALHSKITNLQGLVLISSVVTNRHFRNISLNKIRTPLLIVHHKKDTCKTSSYKNFLKYNWPETSTKIEVVGGLEPVSTPCKAKSYHGFWGEEQNTVLKIVTWLNKNL